MRALQPLLEKIKHIPPFWRKWSTVTYVTILDTRLGVLNWFLRGCVAVYLIVSITYNKQYRIIEEPGGYPTFWFDRSTTNSTHPYCDNAAYDYSYTSSPSYWTDDDIECVSLSYGEAVEVGAAYGFVTTFLKQEHVRSEACGAGDEPCVAAEEGEALQGTRITRSLNVDTLDGTRTCTCGRLHNSFAAGIDDMTFSVQHAFSTSSLMGHVGGSSNHLASTDSQRTIKTCIKVHDSNADECESSAHELDWDKCCKAVFEPGQSITFTIGQWLELGGFHLDERNALNIDPDALTGELPYRRVSGVKVHLKMAYFGDRQTSEFRCEITVVAQDGWSSLGAEDIFTNYTGSTSVGRTGVEFFETYRRGVRFEFFPEGEVSAFSYQVLLNTIISGLVFLQIIPHIVRTVAKHVLPEKKVYAKAIKEEFCYNRSLAKFAVTSALACQAFKTWDTQQEDDGPPKISEEELTAVFANSFDRDTSQKFARLIVEEVHGVGGETSLSCEDLVRLMSTELVSIDTLHMHALKRQQTRQSESAPYQRKKVAPDENGTPGHNS